MHSQTQLLQALDSLDTKAGYSPLAQVGIYELVDALKPLLLQRSIFAHATLDGTALRVQLSNPLYKRGLSDALPRRGDMQVSDSFHHSFLLQMPIPDAIEELTEDIVLQVLSSTILFLRDLFDDPTVPSSPSPFTPIPSGRYPEEDRLLEEDSRLEGTSDYSEMAPSGT